MQTLNQPLICSLQKRILKLLFQLKIQFRTGTT
jgi:hypothetical protein